MNKTLLGLCVLILVAGGAYALYAKDPAFQKSQMPSYAADSSDATQASTTPVAGGGDSIGKHAVNWKFESAGEDTSLGAPKTKVIVTWDGKSHDAGTYLGSCAEIDGETGTLQENEVSGSLCWFGGAGDEIGIFKENGSFVLKHGEQGEPQPGDNVQAFRGNFKTILSL